MLVDARVPLGDLVCLFVEQVMRQYWIIFIVSAVNMTDSE